MSNNIAINCKKFACFHGPSYYGMLVLVSKRSAMNDGINQVLRADVMFLHVSQHFPLIEK